MYDAISVEERNKPAAPLINEGFIDDARSAASGRGMPGVRSIPSSVPCEATDMDEIEAGVTKAMDAVIAALTEPLTEEEITPKPKETEEQARIIFQGSLGEVNQFFYRRGWTDGLPVIPPTEEAVAEMLTGTDLPPDHLLGKLLPRMGKVTVEKIAVNAVMAGAKPEYFPVILALASTGTSSLFSSTSSFARMVVVNGPIAEENLFTCYNVEHNIVCISFP